MSSIDVVCDGTVFATLVQEDLPGIKSGRPKVEVTEGADSDFPAPVKKKRSRSKKSEIVVEID